MTRAYSSWRLTEPKYRDITTYPDGVEGHQWESWGEVILFNGDIDQANQFLESFKSLVDSDVYLSRIKTVIENTERWEKERRIFGDSLSARSFSVKKSGIP